MFEQGYLESELLRVDGELAYRSGDRDAAAESLGGAAEVAAARGADWMELRALTALATRFPDDAVRARLAARLESLPSGYDLPAYRAAKSLLARPG